MDKQNYIISGVEAQVVIAEFEKIQKKVIEKLEESKVIKRKRVVKTPLVLIQAGYLKIVKNLSFQRLSDLMSCKYSVRMSDSAWKKQLRKIAPIFMEAVREYMADCSEESALSSQGEFLGFKNAYAIDATDIAQEGRGNNVMRVHTQLSLNDHASVHAKITDTHTSENVKQLPVYADHLYMADRAYGKAGQLAYLFERKADFIFRISPSLIRLYKDELCKERLELLPYLSDADFSINVYIKYEGKAYPLRVIGGQLPEEKQPMAEKRVRLKASKNRTKIQAATILYSKWIIIATSLDQSVSSSKILAAYRERWQIELFFKRSKSLLGLKKRLVLHHSILQHSFSYG